MEKDLEFFSISNKAQEEAFRAYASIFEPSELLFESLCKEYREEYGDTALRAFAKKGGFSDLLRKN
ncbi:MAG TPA: hypothetical protein VJ044_15655, partial [Candidatus Hodarchaeales archaeon]|nr:hypothetical protein [Candidatus Hodarchaeales archaeon]